jgi:hypothetical protein
MTAKVIKFPSLPTGLTISVNVRSLSSLAILEAVSLTEGTSDQVSVYSGTITGAHAGQLLFDLIISGTVFDSRVRTIQDSAGPWVIPAQIESVPVDHQGAYTISILVTDDEAEPVQGAKLRFSNGVLSWTRTTDPDGECSIPLDAGTWSVGITRAGYDSLLESLVVSTADDVAYELTPNVIVPASDPGMATGWIIIYDEDNQPEADVVFNIQQIAGPGTAGRSPDGKIRSETSDENGVVSFTNLAHGSRYTAWRGPDEDIFDASAFVAQPQSERKEFTVPVADNFNIPEVLGTDAEVAE